ncbi:MAG: succinylglutamate desuccinylase/aspartoacylase family protein [Halofilum sp. (in: g-proteobacteria)]|nr:succinylglutamate desuccinylase/aspartoacylase family protein [Halofilum sp. (in: g-proteobacteria)]
MANASRPRWHDQGSGHFYDAIEVTRTLYGTIELPLHAVIGARPGPVVGVTATVHGDETVPPMMLRTLFQGLDAEDLAGTVCAIPVCNPPAMMAYDRQTPEQHGKTDLHEVFPGNANGNITQRLAHAICTELLDHVDVHIDYHCGGSGGRLQERVDYHAGAEDALKARSLDLARCFGTTMVHENNLAGTAVGYVNGLGRPAFNAETAGVYLGPRATHYYMEAGVEGLRNVMRALEMLPNEPRRGKRQLRYGADSRVEVNPSRGGYLESGFEDHLDLGRELQRGTTLGRLIDMWSLEVVEELVAPVDGYLFFSRYSGVVDSGTKAFALAAASGTDRLE